MFAMVTGSPFVLPVLRLEVHGRIDPARKKGPLIVVSNHVGVLDVVAINFLVFPARISYLGSPRLFGKNPIQSVFLYAFGTHVLGEGESGQDAVDFAVSILREGEMYGIMPEGRIEDTGALLPFKTGAARIALGSGALVQPLYFRKRRRLAERVRVWVGEPIDPKDPAVARLGVRGLTDALYDAIAALKAAAGD
jgi:1-acyl-sn-glycerol-3-phosphate acyltransferase